MATSNINLKIKNEIFCIEKNNNQFLVNLS